MTDISREAVETVAFHLGHSHPDEAPMGQAADMILALRAALDAAEARERQAVEAKREACAALCDTEADKCDDAAKWGGAAKYIANCKAAAYAMRDRAAAHRAGYELARAEAAELGAYIRAYDVAMGRK